MLTAHVLNDRIRAHAMEIPPNARLLFCNGQVGTRLDGTVRASPREQVEVIVERIGIIVAAVRMFRRTWAAWPSGADCVLHFYGYCTTRMAMQTETLSLRISKAERRALRERARREGVSQGNLVRRALRAYGVTPE